MISAVTETLLIYKDQCEKITFSRAQASGSSIRPANIAKHELVSFGSKNTL